MEDKTEKNLGTALAVVEAQQKVVGSSLVATSNSALLAESTDSQSQILEQIRDIQVRTLRGVGNVVDQLKKALGFEKDKARLEKQQQTELGKEKGDEPLQITDQSGGDGGDDEQKKGGGIFGFLGALPGAGFIKKLFAPIIAFFGKGGLLVKLFGRFGPLGALILGFTLVYKYSDEIAKALAPALDKIKSIITKMQPAIDVLMAIGDFLIKGIIKGIGEALSFVFVTVEKFIDGFKKLFSGDILGGINDIFEGIVRAVFAIPLMIINFLKPLFMDLVNLISEPWNKMVNAIHEYVGNLFTGIKDFFSGIYDSVIGFFTNAYATAKETITKDINEIFTFFSNIFTAVGEFFSNAYTKIKDFVTSIPDKIMSFVKNMFAPIINFFSGIGNAIKRAINGIIDALPLPDFIKSKIKFDTPSREVVETFEQEPAEMPKLVNQGKSLKQELGENKDMINEYTQTRGLPINLEQTHLMNKDRAKKEKILIFGGNYPGAYTDMIPMSKLEEAIANVKETGYTAQAQRAEENKVTPKINPDDIKSPEEAKSVTVINKGGDTVQQSNVSAKSDIYSGQLNVSVDGYHDRNAVGIPT